MAKYSGQNVALEYDADGMPTWTNIPQLRDFNPPEQLAEVIDSTTHDSSLNSYRDYLDGLLDLGDMTFEIAYDPADSAHQWLAGAGKAGFNNFRVTFPDTGATTWVFSGKVTSIAPKNPVGDLQVADVTIKCKAAITVA